MRTVYFKIGVPIVTAIAVGLGAVATTTRIDDAAAANEVLAILFEADKEARIVLARRVVAERGLTKKTDGRLWLTHT
jgi:hypothetical protein